MLRRYRGAGIDPLREKILTYPVLHYQNGGLVIDTDAATTLEGGSACGEIAGAPEVPACYRAPGLPAFCAAAHDVGFRKIAGSDLVGGF